MQIIRIFLAALALLCTLSAHAESLTVAVAANVKFAFEELAAEFGRQTGIAVQPVVSSSGKLTAQIKSGAPYDVFLSADMDYPQALFKEGAAATVPRVYASGALVLWTRKDLDLAQGVAGLAAPGVARVAIANPKLAPYGRETLKALEHYQVRAAVEPKLVYGESISQVNQYIDTQSVDVGFTAKSVVLSPDLAGKGRWVEVPAQSYDPIAQGVVILRHGQAHNGAASRKFYGFLFTPPARAIFEKYGYRLP